MTEDKKIMQDTEESSDALGRKETTEFKGVNDAPRFWGGSNSGIWGIVLVAAGGLLLLRNLTGFDAINLNNWWAVFILVPGISMLVNAFNNSRRGRFLGRQAIGGVIIVLLALMFFFEIDFDLFWPVLLILGGVGLLFKPSWQAR